MRTIAAFTFGILAVTAAIARADGVDEAEARKRGVAVEVVELERAKQQITELQKQVAELKVQLTARADEATKAKQLAAATAAELARLRQTMSPQQRAAVAAAVDHDKAVQNAIASHQILVGMSMEEVAKVCRGWKPVLESDSSAYKIYEVAVPQEVARYGREGADGSYVGDPATGMVTVHPKFLIRVEEGKVTAVDKE